MATGNPPLGAPARSLVSLRTAEPAVDSTGRLSPWLAQVLQRLLDLVGPADGSGVAITSRVSQANVAISIAAGAQNSSLGSAAQDIAALQAAASLLPPRPSEAVPAPFLPPVPAGAPWFPDTDLAYDFSVYIPGLVGASGYPLWRTQVMRPFMIPKGFYLSLADAVGAATNSTTMNFQKNGSTFGSLNFAASSTTGVYTLTADTWFARGDFLQLNPPAVADPTLSYMNVGIAGQRPAT